MFCQYYSTKPYQRSLLDLIHICGITMKPPKCLNSEYFASHLLQHISSLASFFSGQTSLFKNDLIEDKRTLGRKTCHIFPHKLPGKSFAMKTSQCKYTTVSFEGVKSLFSWLVSLFLLIYVSLHVTFNILVRDIDQTIFFLLQMLTLTVLAELKVSSVFYTLTFLSLLLA